MLDYRRERIRIIRDMISNLTLILTLPIFKLERIPYKYLQNVEKNIEEWLVLANTSERYVDDTHISPNGHDDGRKTKEESIDSHIS